MAARGKGQKCEEYPKGYTTSQGLLKHMRNVHQKINNLLSPKPSTEKQNVAVELSFNSEQDETNDQNDIQLIDEEQIPEEAIDDQDLYEALDQIMTQTNENNFNDINNKVIRFKTIIAKKNKIIEELKMRKIIFLKYICTSLDKLTLWRHN